MRVLLKQTKKHGNLKIMNCRPPKPLLHKESWFYENPRVVYKNMGCYGVPIGRGVFSAPQKNMGVYLHTFRDALFKIRDAAVWDIWGLFCKFLNPIAIWFRFRFGIGYESCQLRYIYTAFLHLAISSSPTGISSLPLIFFFLSIVVLLLV